MGDLQLINSNLVVSIPLIYQSSSIITVKSNIIKLIYDFYEKIVNHKFLYRTVNLILIERLNIV